MANNQNNGVHGTRTMVRWTREQGIEALAEMMSTVYGHDRVDTVKDGVKDGGPVRFSSGVPYLRFHVIPDDDDVFPGTFLSEMDEVVAYPSVKRYDASVLRSRNGSLVVWDRFHKVWRGEDGSEYPNGCVSSDMEVVL